MAKRVCRCCGEARPSVANRNRIRREYAIAGAPVWMCEPCWEDPAILKAECRHGVEAATASERIRERLRQVW